MNVQLVEKHPEGARAGHESAEVRLSVHSGRHDAGGDGATGPPFDDWASCSSLRSPGPGPCTQVVVQA